jgi:hypothetical protein
MSSDSFSVFKSLDLEGIEPEPAGQLTVATQEAITRQARKSGFSSRSSAPQPIAAERGSGRSHLMMNRTLRVQVDDFNVLRDYSNRERVSFGEAFHEAVELFRKSKKL